MCHFSARGVSRLTHTNCGQNETHTVFTYVGLRTCTLGRAPAVKFNCRAVKRSAKVWGAGVSLGWVVWCNRGLRVVAVNDSIVFAVQGSWGHRQSSAGSGGQLSSRASAIVVRHWRLRGQIVFTFSRACTYTVSIFILSIYLIIPC